MGVNSIRADKLSAVVPRMLNKKREALTSGRLLRLCSSSLLLFDGRFMTFFSVRYSLCLKVRNYEDRSNVL